jgi:hypothetical protein
MLRLIARIALTLAILLMPLGMTPSAASEPHHMTAVGAAMQHCPDQAPRHDPKGTLAQCTMACAAAVPASTASAEEPPMVAAELITPAVAERLRGLHPETATPPPKLA